MSTSTANAAAGGHRGGYRAEMLIQLGEVTRRYAGGGAPALDGVSLSVAQGEAVAVMGPSGSGNPRC